MSLKALVALHARGGTLCSAREEAEDDAEVIWHLVIADQDLLHRLGQWTASSSWSHLTCLLLSVTGKDPIYHLFSLEFALK